MSAKKKPYSQMSREERAVQDASGALDNAGPHQVVGVHAPDLRIVLELAKIGLETKQARDAIPEYAVVAVQPAGYQPRPIFHGTPE